MDAPVFISYSSHDKAAADQICASLESAGTPCWIAPRDIPAGADYPSAIIEGVQRSRALVVVVTEAAISSPHILSEVGHAFSEKKPIIPFRLSAAQLPASFDYFLSMSQWLDARDGCTPANLARLQEALSHPRASNTAGGTRSKAPLIGGAAVLVLVIAFAAIAYWNRPEPVKSAPIQPTAEQPATYVAKLTPPGGKPQPWVNPKDGLTYVWVPPGAFVMGCSTGDSKCRPDESPTHPVTFSQGFWMGQTEVTMAAYQHVLGRIKFQTSDANLPVVNVSRDDAKTYCASVGGRLPTEAEWEYATRGGIDAPWYGAPAQIAWYSSNSGNARRPVAMLQANAYGLYDMLGNASEWVLDRYYEKYDPAAPATGSVEEPIAGNAVALTRGGYWESGARDIRVSSRTQMENDQPGPMAGIRCIVDHR